LKEHLPTASVQLQTISAQGFPLDNVANLWTEFTAHDCQQTVADGKECKTLKISWWLQLLKRQYLRFAEMVIMNPHPGKFINRTMSVCEPINFFPTFWTPRMTLR
jgi:hypothetical protein